MLLGEGNFIASTPGVLAVLGHLRRSEWGLSYQSLLNEGGWVRSILGFAKKRKCNRAH